MKHTLALLTALLLASPAGSYAANATNDFLLFETGPFMKENAYADGHTPPPDWRAQSGALRLNAAWQSDKSQPWYIEDQQLGGDYVAAGLAFGNKDEIRWGLKVIEWGFAQMTPDGEFNHPDNYHSGAFFIEATARALLLLEASPLLAEFKDQVDVLKPKLHTTARWMARPDIYEKFWVTPKRGEKPYGHRRFLDAAALGLAGVLGNDKDLIADSAALARAGMAFQRPDGVFPENDGHDSHYQAYALLFACRYYALVADDALRAEMKPKMEKAYAWLLTRIREDGRVDPAGNSRTGFGQEKTRNKAKQKWLEYRFPAISLAYWAQIMKNPDLEKTARRVFEADRRLRADPKALTWDGY